jgi:DNA-binding winged helix-turn-helix (wHTH) protein/tetratricopeptide (TPR) repeat protein
MSLGKVPDFLLNFSGYEMSRETHHFYRFKSFRLDVEERRLFRDDVPVQLEPKVFDVLALLVENSGHLVEKDKLLRTVWADSFVEELNVARAVYSLRKALGEDGNGNKFIETVPKKGYRFIADISEVRTPSERKPQNGNGNSPIGAKELSAPGFAGIPDEADLQISSANDETSAQFVPKPKQKTRIILFAAGFLSALLLLLLWSFSLRSDSAINPNKVKSIAVLPVKPINAGVRDELYEIGIADSLIHRLSATKGFVVRPLSATRKYADIEQDPLAAGREQKVDYVLASNYQLTGGRIRITAQLLNVRNGQVEETYKSEKDASDIFAMQDTVAGEVGNMLLTRFATVSSSPAAKRGTTNEEAYRLYLQGKKLTERRSADNAHKAIEYFEQAIRLDPNFARAFTGMAFAYRASGSLGGGLPREQFEKAKESVDKALELDPNLAEAYAVRGDLKHKFERDWAGAESDLRRAVELEPSSDLGHAAYAEFLAERYSRFDEALAEKEIALAINPGSLVYSRDRGRIFYFARRYDEAIVQLKRVIEADENFQTAYGWLWRAYAMKRDEAEAYKFFMEFVKRTDPQNINIFQKTYETEGWIGVRRKQLELSKLGEHQPTANLYAIAIQCAMLGEKEQAFEYLNKTIEKGHSQIVMLNVEPAFDSLRDDPRFDELLKRVGWR